MCVQVLHVQKRRLPDQQRLSVCRQVAEGLAYLHARKPTILHRDIKTHNVVVCLSVCLGGHSNIPTSVCVCASQLDVDMTPKICDFGLSEAMERSHVTRHEQAGGSPRYMAPELFRTDTMVSHPPRAHQHTHKCTCVCVGGVQAIDEKVDIWALGCLFIEVYGGPLPFDVRTCLCVYVCVGEGEGEDDTRVCAVLCVCACVSNL